MNTTKLRFKTSEVLPLNEHAPTVVSAPPATPSVAKVDFFAIATPLIERGFRVTPVHPESKAPVLKNWPNHQITTLAELKSFLEKNSKYAHHCVGVVGKRKPGRHCFIDIDADGVVGRIESGTGHKIPQTYTVSSRPQSAPYKKHFYFLQTAHSFKAFAEFADNEDPWASKNINIKDLSRLVPSRKGHLIHPTLYDVKGVGGGAIVVGAGSTREGSSEIYAVATDAPVVPIPDWLVDWLIEDFRKYRAAAAAEHNRKRDAKSAERQKHSAYQRRLLRDAGKATGFDIFEEDIYEFLMSRAGSFARLGMRRDLIEAALVAQVEDFCAGGKAFVESGGHRTIQRLVKNIDSHELGDARIFYLPKNPRALMVTGPEMSFVRKYESETEVRHKIMVATAQAFPTKITAREIYERFTAALSEKDFVFDYGISRHRMRAGAALREAGFEPLKDGGTSYWVNTVAVNVAVPGATP